MSHDLSNSHSQLIGFQISSLSHVPQSINSLHSHLHLSSFYLCLLLQTLAFNLQLHLQALCYSICLVSLFFDIKYFKSYRLNNLKMRKSGTHNLVYGS